MEVLSEAREKGIIRAHGVKTCHARSAALKTAAGERLVVADRIWRRVNAGGSDHGFQPGGRSTGRCCAR